MAISPVKAAIESPTMSGRSPFAVLQLAVFVGGSVVAPVVHLARHRPDHTHGPGGWIATFEHGARPHRHPHVHSHPREQGASGHEAPSPGAVLPETVDGESPAAHRGLAANPLEAAHGHGSLVHFGLALLSAPPPLPLPTPRLTAVLAPTASRRATALFHPTFPLPRPPPAPAFS
jgi:hypothetical protein